MHKHKIISELSHHWFSKGVWFGDLIHKLKPTDFNEWVDFLKENKWFFIRRMKWSSNERYAWIRYLKFSFWKLYLSETKTIDYFRNNHNIELKFVDHKLDVKYGIDFYFRINNKTYYLVVKHKLTKYKFSKISSFNNVYLFDSFSLKLYSNLGVCVTHLI